jgi:TolB-like protein/class 3 adenylate cyclase
MERRLAAILAADVAGYSRLMGLDEEGTLAALKAHRREQVDPKIAEHRGRLVKLTGDGMLVEFASAVDALRCAVELQRGMAERNAAVPADRRIVLRIGINVGDVIIDDNDIYGDGVNVAARLEAIAEPGGICVSRTVHDQIGSRLGVAFADMGDQALKNIAQAVRAFRVEIGGDTAPAPPLAQPGPTPAADRPSIAVLAFNNMSGDPEQEYFSDGISEDIITDLSKLSGLHVIARNSSFAYKGKAVDLKQVGRDLGVRYVLEGSVRKAGNRVRVTGQLIDTASGAHVWADRYDRDLTDIFAVQDELTQEIIGALKVRLTPEQQDRRARRRTVDVEAYNLFLRGREQALLLTGSGNAEARRLLERAIAIEPEYGAANACLAFTQLNDYVMGRIEAGRDFLDEVVERTERAIAMDEEDSYPYYVYAVALLWQRRYDEAFAAARRCNELSPSSAEGHLEMASVQFYAGEPAESLRTLEAYLKLDPLYPEIALYFIAQAQEALGQYEAAVETLKKRLARNPNSETSYALLAACYGHLGRHDESRAAWAEVMRIAPDFSIERRRRLLPFKDPAMFDRRLDGMRKAGIQV